MTVKVITRVYEVWAEDEILKGMLSKNSFGKPNISDRWVEGLSTFPYLCYRWEFGEGDHWAKRDCNLIVDLFDKGSSSVNAENIRSRLIEITDRKQFESEESGLIRLYLNGDTIIPEDDPEVVHWNVIFKVIFWRKDFINTLT